MSEPKDEQQILAEKTRRRRSIAIALTLAFMVVAFYVTTFIRFGDLIANKGL